MRDATSVASRREASGASSVQDSAPRRKPRLLDQLRSPFRSRHYSRRTEQAYCRWVKRLIASLLYGTGLRLMECLRLRVQDIDFSRGEILAGDGEGFKDRITMLPECLRQGLQEHLQRVKSVHQCDLAEGWGRLQMPNAPGHKYLINGDLGARPPFAELGYYADPVRYFGFHAGPPNHC